MSSMECDYKFCHPYDHLKSKEWEQPPIVGMDAIRWIEQPPMVGMDAIHWIDHFLNNVYPLNIEIPAPPLKMTAVSTYLPKDNPEKPLGEDGHFISPEFQTIAVADGVGGWAKKGIDSGKYSRQLMENCLLALKEHVNPIRVLEAAYGRTMAAGSSTACIITLSGDRLRAANVGDSGFVVVREGRVVYRSPLQQKRFNCPYQLGREKDDPSVAEEMEVSVERGDVVVVGTDGLLDNLRESEMVRILGDGRIGGLQQQCCYMANAALYNSFDRYAEDLPIVEAARQAGLNYKGGKVDDITVIIARIN